MTRKQRCLLACFAMMSAVMTLAMPLVAVKASTPGAGRSQFPIPLPLRSVYGQTVSAQTGQPVPNVMVLLTGRGVTQSRQSDESGLFQFRNLPPGTYVIQAKGGFPRQVSVAGFDVFVTLQVD